MVNLEDMRKQYDITYLSRNHLLETPSDMFRKWFEEIENLEEIEPNAMILSTANKKGKPSGRIVLLKEYSEKGFIFYTSYDSKKGKEIEKNPYGSLTFNWKKLERQVRIRGKIRKISREKSKKYFCSRPRTNQITVLASRQSELINSRRDIEKRFAVLEKKYKGKDIPVPKTWGGYRLEHKSVEFWQGRRDRLHDRFMYTQHGTTWQIDRLSP